MNAIEKLEEGLEPVPPTKGSSRAEHITWLSDSLKKREKAMRQALALLRQPEGGEFTEKSQDMIDKANAKLQKNKTYADLVGFIDILLTIRDEACDCLSRQAGEIAQLEVYLSDERAENRKLKEAVERYDKMWRAEQKSAADAWLENEKLEENLEKFAWHTKDCAVRAELRVRPDKNCDCGFVETLSKP